MKRSAIDQYTGDQDVAPVIHDEYVAKIVDPNIETVDNAVQAFFTSTPPWLAMLMRLRNRIVGLFGFATGNNKAPDVPETIEVGQQFSVFNVIERSEDEIVMGGDDAHFSMRISVQVPRNERVIKMTTVAHAHDAIGRLYLAIVKIPHGPIAKMLTRRIAGH